MLKRSNQLRRLPRDERLPVERLDERLLDERALLRDEDRLLDERALLPLEDRLDDGV